MFTPNQERAAAEMMRVCRAGGKIGLANWTPNGFIGQIFKTLGARLPPPAGVRSPALWGTRERLMELFGPGATVRQTRASSGSAIRRRTISSTRIGPITARC